MQAAPNILVTLAVSSSFFACAPDAQPRDVAPVDPEIGGATNAAPDSVRVALFNIRELSGQKLDEVAADGSGANAQLRAAAEIVRRIRPDILVINEIDHDMDGASLDGWARRFAALYLAAGENGVAYPYSFVAPNNTGVLSGLDLNADGVSSQPDDQGLREYGEDAFGFGTYPGQYSMVVLSSVPLDADRARTFQRFRWTDLPNSHMPDGFYSMASRETLRLSSKSHWDIPARLPGHTLRLLVSHPTPPVFDGDEDRNGRRNFDEIGFWSAYLDDSPWLYDDRGVNGGYNSDEAFLIIGDLNARPDASDGVYEGKPAVQQLLQHARVQDTGGRLTSAGALAGREPGPPSYLERSTAVFSGGWRLDYLLPSTDVTVADGGVFWPDPGEDPEAAALAEAASDHRLIWLDLVLN
jgi:endonuclease/exonuclease/phosphatase family metal-dependent hydrolase